MPIDNRDTILYYLWHALARAYENYLLAFSHARPLLVRDSQCSVRSTWGGGALYVLRGLAFGVVWAAAVTATRLVWAAAVTATRHE